MTAAKRRAIDSLSLGRMLVQKHEEIARELEWQQQQLGDALEHSLDQMIDEDILRLIFTPSGAHGGSTHRPGTASFFSTTLRCKSTHLRSWR
jgi:predicted RNA polymerase sigma factor